MKTLCITGSVQSRLDPFAESLKQAGASAALSARTDRNLSMADWHRQVLAVQKEHEPLPASWSPGHEWEQLAREIFLANQHRPLWYWAETSSALLLDFWSDFDPAAFFLLLHVSPHEVLMNAVEHGADTPEALQSVLDDWYKRTRQMLRFHLRHPGRSLLLDSRDVLEQPNAYLDALNQRWQLPLEAAESEQSWRTPPHRPTLYLLDKLLQHRPQALALHHEVQASLFLIDHNEAPLSIPELGDVVSGYLEERRLFKTAQAQLADTSQALQDRQMQLASLESDLRQLQANIEQYRQELTETRSDLENSDQENRLLLEQLRHTRESLESLTKENQHKDRQLAELNAEKDTLQNKFDEQSRSAVQEQETLAAACDKQTRLASERKAQIDQLEAEKNRLQTSIEQYHQELSATRGDLENAEQEGQLLLDQLHQTQEELEKLILEEQRKTHLLAALETDKQQLLEKTEQYHQELSATRSDFENAEQENLLLLDQLHQTQEELEKLILEEQHKTQLLANLNVEKHSLLDQLDVLVKEKTDLLIARDILNKEKADLLAVHDALKKEKTVLAAARDEQAKLANERQTRLDTLAREKADLLASRDTLDKEKTDLLAARDALSKEKAALAAARDEQAKLANDRQAQLGKLAKEHEQLQSQASRTLEASENENQQLLIQLHQTQEELERSLLLYQASQAQLDEHQARLQKVLKHHPDYWDFDTLEIELLKSDNTQQITQWRLTELYIGGRLIPEIRFKTCLVNGLAGIVIQRTEGTNSPAPLLRWPNAFANSEELPCIPTRGASTLGSNAALSGLGTSDWDTLQHLTKQLAGFLAQPTDGRIPRKLNTAALRNGLLAFAKTLAKWPRMLRYDSIQLQETLRNQGYERLGISLGNLRLDHHLWPALDYRLATVDRGPHSFGQNPRLEFPDGSARGVLQHWFEESGDNNNPRLELRFAQPNAMDTRVWGMLSPNDQQLIGALIKTLPLQLEDLKQANPAASRPWQDWQALAGMLRDTLRDNLIRSTAPRRSSAEIEE